MHKQPEVIGVLLEVIQERALALIWKSLPDDLVSFVIRHIPPPRIASREANKTKVQHRSKLVEGRSGLQPGVEGPGHG